jgi:pyrroline-5-carboxylate reductase
MTDASGTEGRRFAVLGGGNLGTAIARGLVRGGRIPPARVAVTRRHPEPLGALADEGHPTGSDNAGAVRGADVLVICVQPQQLDELLEEIVPVLEPDRHVIVSTVSGASIAAIRSWVGERIPVVRAMPNMGAQIWESMTCLAADPVSEPVLPVVEEVFGGLGVTVRIDEEQINPATALCACGVAFFLRAIRAAAQGGIEIGFHSDQAIRMAAQTAKGAAELVLANRSHPEIEIDRVTTPNGCTIAGLNEMENRGFSSSMIRGIVTSARVAAALYSSDDPPRGNDPGRNSA